jgi:hypothetical protein
MVNRNAQSSINQKLKSITILQSLTDYNQKLDVKNQFQTRGKKLISITEKSVSKGDVKVDMNLKKNAKENEFSSSS